MFRSSLLPFAASLFTLGTGAAQAAGLDKINFAFQWVAGGDHAPYYYAKKMGLYEKAGLDVSFEHLRGSSAAAQKVGAGAAQLGLADMGVVLVARGKGADLVGVMNVYANSPQGLYWLKSSGIRGVKDLAGKKIGNPAGDAARQMWPALAKGNGIDPNSVTWVNIDANAKLAALKAKTIDATTSFYNLHHVFKRELGEDMGFLAWRDAGLNPYGNTVIAYGPYLRDKKDRVAAFVKVTQKAFSDCVAAPKPCIEALVAAHGALKFDNEMENWELVTELMTDQTSQSKGLGWMDDKRMADDYKLVETFFSIDKPFGVKSSYTNEFLDPALKMAKRSF
jgi:NitT/TauT family transport system substrate-binding protein